MQRLCSGIGKHTSEKPHNILVVWTGFSQLGAKSLSLPGKFPCCLQRSCFIIFIPRTRAENGGIQITLAGGSIHGGPPIAGRYLTENLENPEKKGGWFVGTQGMRRQVAVQPLWTDPSVPGLKSPKIQGFVWREWRETPNRVPSLSRISPFRHFDGVNTV